MPSSTLTVRSAPSRSNPIFTVSPGFRVSIALWSSCTDATESPSTDVITSPAWSPAAAAGAPLRTSETSAPATPLCVWVSPPPWLACSTVPPAPRGETIYFPLFDGTANPTPSLPPESLSICELTPTTRPSRSSSGPPELPWLIAASVWIAPLIV